MSDSVPRFTCQNRIYLPNMRIYLGVRIKWLEFFGNQNSILYRLFEQVEYPTVDSVSSMFAASSKHLLTNSAGKILKENQKEEEVCWRSRQKEDRD